MIAELACGRESMVEGLFMHAKSEKQLPLDGDSKLEAAGAASATFAYTNLLC